jgi:hypothetical protein
MIDTLKGLEEPNEEKSYSRIGRNDRFTLDRHVVFKHLILKLLKRMAIFILV